LSVSECERCRQLEDEKAKLLELLRGVGANRYWEGRWRDADAELIHLRAETQRAVDHYDIRSELYTNDADVGAGMASILRQVLEQMSNGKGDGVTPMPSSPLCVKA
jgi:hypothetical protein